jgi:tRNA (guanine-N7-)-methyltransferase
MSLAHRPIRTYVLRQGRMTEAQRRARAELLPRLGIPYSSAPLDLVRLYGRAAPKILEIGSGMGETTARIAAENPGNDYLAVEVHAPGVGSLLARVAASDLANVRVIEHDAVEVVRDMIPAESLAGVHVFFPDPWPKKRHHKRRLVTPEHAHLVAGRMRAGATWRLATDWAEYAEQMVAVLDAEPLLEGGVTPRWEERPLTRFERKGIAAGREITDLCYRRRG